MEEIIGEIGKGFLRGIGYLLAEIFFWTLCYWLGWPICKVLSFGAYPESKDYVYLGEAKHSGFWCAAVGLLVFVIIAVYFLGGFN